MRITTPASVRRLRKAIIEQRPDPRRRDDSGLTTLEWLLIVAAVAGLAALAVVLVTRVVTDTSEQISGSSARLTSARLEADDIERRVLTATGTAADLNEEYGRLCRRLSITYGTTFEAQTPTVTVQYTNGVDANTDNDFADGGDTAPTCEIG